MDTCIINSYIIDLCIIDSCIIGVEVEKDVLVNSAWVTWPERPKGAKDDVKRPKGPPARSRGPRFVVLIIFILFLNLHSAHAMQQRKTQQRTADAAVQSVPMSAGGNFDHPS